ncbi:MAG TPA: DUF5107 domain-containing protein [Verrucomicrobiota bacterium]|nr:DUF5107 domain-containing protein [Verrucomicrobiota bacterium]HNU49361.1 DUF5107 domain-containing protein [Verrucomicrobiota bacterium]
MKRPVPIRLAREPRAIPATVWELAALIAALIGSGQAAGDEVRLYETNLVLPTYRVAAPDPNPRFYQGRTYQGARATFYPYPVTDRLTGEKADHAYHAVCLENRHVHITVLPELGGRLFTAVDKSNGYDFFYRQRGIKPALIGMLGAWISGGVEWNVPHHHRATSFLPVDWTTEEAEDGSRTIWVGETEWRHRMRWIVGIRLRPDRSWIELDVKVFNRTPFAHAFLFWINPAVHANDQYQVVFPPDTEFAVQHGKPEFARWPIAREVYGGVDYTRGVDISWWKSHPSPVSFFCFRSDQDFFGGYDHGRRAGVLHWADHHAVPGKKFFEWGTGAEGDMWTRLLSDADGPYLELMAGAYSDNQPDYSVIQPGETKSWTHTWYPIRDIGGAKNATRDAAVNLDVSNRVLRVGFHVTAEFPGARIRLQRGGTNWFETTTDLSPAAPYVREWTLEEDAAPEEWRAALVAADHRELVAYQPKTRPEAPLPEPARRPAPPRDIPGNDELFFTGQRVEQLYSPSFEAAPYYEEALRRDPGDYRANTALGLLRAREGRWEEAETLLSAAIARATAHYIRPKDGEAFYYLGVVLKARGRQEAAADAFQRAVWSAAWQAAGYQQLAELDALRGRWAQALEWIDRSLIAGALNTRARNLKAALLRRLGRPEAAEATARGTCRIDPLDFGALNELVLALDQSGRTVTARELDRRLTRLMRGETQSYLELASDYSSAGLWTEAIGVLDRSLGGDRSATNASPLVFYHLGYCCEQADNIQSLRLYQHAARIAPDFCFPFRLEEERILHQALGWNPEDARGWYYLGNLLYDRQPERAIEAWERARTLQPSFALVHRNLGLAYAQTRRDPAAAVESLEQAVALNPAEPRFHYELDLQYEAAGAALAKRLAVLTQHHDVVAQRDDALTREIRLLIAAGETDRALSLLQTHRFHNWEGSSEIHDVYVDARLRRGRDLARAGQLRQALDEYTAALEYPDNLEVGRPHRDRRAPLVHCFQARAHAALGETEQAQTLLEQAVARLDRSASETAYWQARALQQLGRNDEAQQLFSQLAAQGEARQTAGETADYFAKFGERQSERVRQAQGHFLAGLGYAGQGRDADARAAFTRAVELHPAHLGALTHLAEMEADTR